MRRSRTLPIALVALICALAVTYLLRDFILGSDEQELTPVTEEVVIQRQTSVAEQPQQAAPRVQRNAVSILIATKFLPVGARLQREDVTWLTVNESEALPGYVTGPADDPLERERIAGEKFQGAFVRLPIRVRDPIREDDLMLNAGSGFMSVLLPQGRVAVSIPVTNEAAVSGFVLPGDFVDIVATEVLGSVRRARILLAGVKIIAVDNRTAFQGGGNATSINPNRGVTVEVTERQALLLIEARDAGQLSLILRSVSDPSLGGFGTSVNASEDGLVPQSVLDAQKDLEANEDPVVVIRFGIPSEVYTQ